MDKEAREESVMTAKKKPTGREALYWVSTMTMLLAVSNKKQATAYEDAFLYQACECGCGKMAGKPIARIIKGKVVKCT